MPWLQSHWHEWQYVQATRVSKCKTNRKQTKAMWGYKDHKNQYVLCGPSTISDLGVSTKLYYCHNTALLVKTSVWGIDHVYRSAIERCPFTASSDEWRFYVDLHVTSFRSIISFGGGAPLKVWSDVVRPSVVVNFSYFSISPQKPLIGI